jgi:two-component system chemotaxis sensor kinase CheA
VRKQDELLSAFLTESGESLDRLDADLVALERDPQNAALLDGTFRTLHTLKGSASFLQFSQLATLAHTAENLLTEVRSGKTTLTPESTNSLLQLVDNIRALVQHIAQTGCETGSSHTGPTLDHRQSPPAIPVHPARMPSNAPSVPPAPVATQPFVGLAAPLGPRQPEPAEPARPPLADPRPPPRRGDVSPSPEKSQPSRLAGEPSVELDGSRSEGGSSAFKTESVRVGVGLLDQLMNLVGELVLNRNQIVQFSQKQSDPAYAGYSQRLNLITSQLQESVMKTRLQPVGALWQRFPRLVRDIARQCGKEVALEIEGAETELDKTLLEALSDPMLHLVRNAIDHGIERPELRRFKGKTPQGRLQLRAYHEGGQVHIEICDDGAGLNTETIRSHGINRGLYSQEDSLLLSEEQIHESIFLPGFSTAEQVTDLSGRGVGLDVVKTSIEHIGGLVDISSRAEQGTTVHIKVPLTLAIIPTLIVTSGGQRYAIPQVNLSELIAIRPSAAGSELDHVHQSPVYRLRDRLLPLVRLDQLLGQPTAAGDDSEPVHLVVIRVGDERFALKVDGISNSEEIVVKSLGSVVRGVPLYAGATILGDGSVALILDVLGLARHAGVFKELRRPQAAESLPSQMRIVPESVLVCDVGADRRIGIPLPQVVRIVRVPRSEVEVSFDQEIVQYRDDLLPLVDLHRYLRHQPCDCPGETLAIIICRRGDGAVGLLVDRVLEIVEVPPDVQVAEGDDVVSGTTVLLGRVTDVVDLPALLRRAAPVAYRPSTRSQLLQTRPA